MSPNERVRLIRKDQGLSMEKFAQKIGVGASAIAKIEYGERGLTDQMVRSICREYGVSEKWLRDGDGEMYDSTEAFSLDEYAKQNGVTDLDLEFMKAYFSIDKETRQKFMTQLRDTILSEEAEKRQALHDELDQELNLQKKQTEKSTNSHSIAG